MRKSARSGHRKKSKKQKWLLYSLAALFSTGIIASAYAVSNSAAQVAAAAATQKGGQCEQTYQKCMKDPKQKDKKKCENDWRNCVSEKCTDSKVKDGKITTQQCPKDADCEYSCTEAASSKEGLLSCCQGVPKHNNSCKKKIDNKCGGANTPFPFFPGKSYGESEKIPSEAPTMKKDLLTGKTDMPGLGDYRMVIDPRHLMTWPEDTVFDEHGMPSQPPTTGVGNDNLNKSSQWDLTRLAEEYGFSPKPPEEYQPSVQQQKDLQQFLETGVFPVREPEVAPYMEVSSNYITKSPEDFQAWRSEMEANGVVVRPPSVSPPEEGGDPNLSPEDVANAQRNMKPEQFQRWRELWEAAGWKFPQSETPPPPASQSTFTNPNTFQTLATPPACHFQFLRWCLW